MIDVCVMATLRPEILETTLWTFRHNLFDGEFGDSRVIVNVDPVGDGDVDGMTDVLRRYCLLRRL